MREQLTESKMHALDYWQVIRNRWGVILLTFFLVALASLVIIMLMDKKYVGRVRLEVHEIASQSEIFSNDGLGQRTSRNFMETQFKIITSKENLKRVAEDKNLKARFQSNTVEDAADKLLGMVETQEERGTDLMTIEVFSTDPVEAAELANAVADNYAKRREDLEKERALSVTQVLESKQNEQEKKAEEARERMLTIQKQFKIVDNNPISMRGFNSGTVSNPDMMNYMQGSQRKQEMEMEVKKLETQLNTLMAVEGEKLISNFMTLGVNDSTITNFYPEFQKTKLELDTLLASGFGAKHPQIKGLNRKQTETQAILIRAATNYKESLKINIDNIGAQLKEVSAMVADSKTKNIEDQAGQSLYATAKHEYEMQLELLNEMREHFLKIQVEKGMPRKSIQFHETAQPSPVAVRPNVPLFLMLGCGLGLVLGLVLAFFLEYLDTSVKTLDDVERYLGVPVLAVIPKDVGVLHKQSGLSPDAEAYRILRTNIEFNRKSADANAITVVSGGAGEGKSTTLVNLAYICAQGGYNTLMIDGDLRRPKLHTFFDINNSVGLTNYLTTALMLEDVILQTPIENLYFMPSGILPADAAGILNSRRMSELIADVKNRFDLVLIDSPPILGVSDASVLASEVDLTMIVIQHRKLPRQMLMRVKQAIENVGGNLLGVVLNNVDVRSDSQYQYYTSYYTYYTPSNTDPKPKSRAGGAAPSASSRPVAPAPMGKPQADEDDY